jgi:hypothetical protein
VSLRSKNRSRPRNTASQGSPLQVRAAALDVSSGSGSAGVDGAISSTTAATAVTNMGLAIEFTWFSQTDYWRSANLENRK